MPYFDHFLKTREHKENLDNWYEADRNVKRGSKSPTKFMHANQIDIAEGLAYIPSDQKDIWRNGLRYINAYRPYEPIKLTQDEIKNIRFCISLRNCLCQFLCPSKQEQVRKDVQSARQKKSFLAIFYERTVIQKK